MKTRLLNLSTNCPQSNKILEDSTQEFGSLKGRYFKANPNHHSMEPILHFFEKRLEPNNQMDYEITSPAKSIESAQNLTLFFTEKSRESNRMLGKRKWDQTVTE